MSICERIGCTLLELPRRMSREEYLVWAARISTHPISSPDRWYSKMLSVMLKQTDPEKHLPVKYKLSHLLCNVDELAQQARSAGKGMWGTLKSLLGIKHE